MARPKRQDNEPETRDKILRAARIEFAAQGIAAPLDAIASRCGIRRPSLLHYFPSKQALIAAVTEDILLRTRSRLLEVIGASPPSDTQDDQTEDGYTEILQKAFTVLRELEREEQGVGGVLIHAMLLEDENGDVTRNMREFIDMIYATIMMAGGQRGRSEAELRASLAHLVMGEVTRNAFADRASLLWGEADGLEPLFKSYLLE